MTTWNVCDPGPSEGREDMVMKRSQRGSLEDERWYEVRLAHSVWRSIGLIFMIAVFGHKARGATPHAARVMTARNLPNLSGYPDSFFRI